MATSRRPTQIMETKIEKLVAMANEKGHTTDEDIAKWIISVSAWWRSEGYKRILEAMKNGTQS